MSNTIPNIGDINSQHNKQLNVSTSQNEIVIMKLNEEKKSGPKIQENKATRSRSKRKKNIVSFRIVSTSYYVLLTPFLIQGPE